MSKARSLRKRQLRQALRVPLWYWILLAAIALVGSILIVISISATSPRIRAGGLSTEGDYFLGASDAPVTIYEWGNFT